MTDQSEIDLIRSNIEYIKKFCSNNRHHADESLIVKCDALLACSEKVHIIQCDLKANNVIFKEIPCNGYLVFLRTVLAFTNQIVTHIRNKNRLDQNFIKLFKAMLFYRDWLFEVHAILEKESETGDRRMMVEDLSFTSKACYNVTHMDKNVVRILYSTAASFWLDESTKKVIRFLIFQVAVLTKPPCSFSSLFSSADMGKFYLKAVKNCNLDYPFSVWQRVESWFVTKFMNNLVINRKIPVISSTIQVPKQTRFILNSKGDILDFDRLSEQEKENYNNDEDEQVRLKAPGKSHRNWNTIKCRYSRIMNAEKVKESVQRLRIKRKYPKTQYDVLKYHTVIRDGNSDHTVYEQNNNSKFTNDHKSQEDNDQLKDDFEINPEKTLLLYIHGGGFFAGGSTSCELFLREICDNLAGVPILAIDYSLTVPYPIPNQECLDVYLWALSGQDDVKETLGFHPERIVVSGDSAGGFLSISLVTILSELNKIKNVKMPISIVAAYPVYSLVNLSIAKTQSVLEPLIETHLLLLIYAYYGANVWSNVDFKQIEDTARYKKIVEKNKNITSEGIQNEFRPTKNVKDTSPWFLCDYPTYKNRSDYINSFFKHPFISPKLYAPSYDKLKDISLYVFAGDQDPTIDDCSELAKRWRGKVCFDSFENIIHGFLTFCHASKLSNEALKFVTRRYQEACGLI